MPYKAEVAFTVMKPFKVDNETTLEAGGEFPYDGSSNHERLVRTGYVEQRVKFLCRKPRCKKVFAGVPELLEHEKSHEG